MQAELDDILGQPLLLLSYPLKAESAGSLSFLVPDVTKLIILISGKYKFPFLEEKIRVGSNYR